MNTPALGPAVISTIMSRNYRASIDAWCDFLHQHVHSEVTITDEGADNWGVAELAGHRITWLANELNEAWLRIVEAPDAIRRQPFETYGWMALEIGVEDVSELYDSLIDSPFRVAAEPADNGLSDEVTSIQAIGLDGEVLRLTELKATVERFGIPQARCAVDRMFNAIAAVPNRGQALEFYDKHYSLGRYSFDRELVTVNETPGLTPDHKHTVAVTQLQGQTLLELIEIPNLRPALDNNAPFTGVVAISFEVTNLPENAHVYDIIQGPHRGRKGCVAIGAAGEFMELIERTS